MSIRKLNIMMSYPVRWSMYKVLRDYIQNFYDALTYRKFKEGFTNEYDPEEKTLKMISDVVFDKEWLFYIGASTKQGTAGVSAGKFGEGFKIASLIAYRDYGVSIRMESGDWIIKVTEDTITIDSKEMPCLAYDIEDRQFEPGTVLALKGIDEDRYKDFLSIIDDFFYVENPRFGNPITIKDRYAVFLNPVRTKRKLKNGYIYVGYQNRKRIPLPIIVCDHDYEINRDDRDRDDITDYRAEDCLEHVFGKLGCNEAFKVLEALQCIWNGKAVEYLGFDPRRIIRILVSKVSQKAYYKRIFRKKYEAEYVACPKYDYDRLLKRRAVSWFRHSEYHKKCRVIMNEFSQLGIPEMVYLCDKAGGFDVLEEPDVEEVEYIQILSAAAEKYFSDLYQYKKLPPCKVIINEDTPCDGLAKMEKNKKEKKNKYGLEKIYLVKSVNIRRKVLKESVFGDALAVYLHELLHQYGGDCSRQFNRALMIMNIKMLEIGDGLEMYEQSWRERHGR